MKDLTNRLLHESDKHVEARELRYLVLKNWFWACVIREHEFTDSSLILT